ncbi:MAG: pseudouridine synthase [Lachnospiraceae bacterium]
MTMAVLRLDKYLADMGVGTRSQVKQKIRKGLIQVNQIVVKEADYKVDLSKDRILADGQQISYVQMEYYMLHKPAGYVSATEDKREKTVLELLPEQKRKDLFPVGRLDKDTEGLLLITNDGALAHRLLSPKKHVEKTYFARIRGMVTEADAALFREGLDIGDEKKTLPASLVIQEAGEDISQVWITLCEGRFHQIKRMFEAVGKEVVYLKRLSMGPLTLDASLPVGSCRHLTQQEIERIQTYDRK